MSMRDLSLAWKKNLPAMHKLILIYIADASGENGVRLSTFSVADVAAFASTMPAEVESAINYLLANDHLRHWWPAGGGDDQYYQVVQKLPSA